MIEDNIYIFLINNLAKFEQILNLLYLLVFKYLYYNISLWFFWFIN